MQCALVNTTHPTSISSLHNNYLVSNIILKNPVTHMYYTNIQKVTLPCLVIVVGQLQAGGEDSGSDSCSRFWFKEIN